MRTISEASILRPIKYQIVTPIAGVATLDCGAGYYVKIAMTGDVTLAFLNRPNNGCLELLIEGTQDSVGGRQLFLPPGILSSNGEQPWHTQDPLCSFKGYVTVFSDGSTHYSNGEFQLKAVI